MGLLSLKQLIRKVPSSPLTQPFTMCRSIAALSPPDILFQHPSATPTDFVFPATLTLATLPLQPKHFPCETVLLNKPTTLEPLPKRSTGLKFEASADGVTFKDAAFVREINDRVTELICTAALPGVSSANARLAQKALKYRKIDVVVVLSTAAAAANTGERIPG